MGGGSRIQFMDNDNHPEPRSAMDRAREMHAAYKAKNQASSSKIQDDGSKMKESVNSDQASTTGEENKRFGNPLQID